VVLIKRTGNCKFKAGKQNFGVAKERTKRSLNALLYQFIFSCWLMFYHGNWYHSKDGANVHTIQC